MNALPTIKNKINDLWGLIGNTPMLEITLRYRNKIFTVFSKCEHYNLTGSIKDRMALFIMEKAYEQNLIKPGDIIVEATSGNTGISFSAIGKALGHQVRIIMPNWLSKERIEIIKSLGAEIVLVSKEEGGFLGCIAQSQIMAKQNKNIFLPQQFENRYNCEAHAKTTAKEIWMQLQSLDKTADAFAAGVGTGGTIMGVGSYLKHRNPNIKIHPLEPAESPTLTTGYKIGTHRIQGISDEFIPAIVNLNMLDEIIQISDSDAILMAQKLASQLGLAEGISSGANLIGGLLCQEKIGNNSTVSTVFADSNKKYLTTDLIKEEPVHDHCITPFIELLDYRAIGRISIRNLN